MKTVRRLLLGCFLVFRNAEAGPPPPKPTLDPITGTQTPGQTIFLTIPPIPSDFTVAIVDDGVTATASAFSAGAPALSKVLPVIIPTTVTATDFGVVIINFPGIGPTTLQTIHLSIPVAPLSSSSTSNSPITTTQPTDGSSTSSVPTTSPQLTSGMAASGSDSTTNTASESQGSTMSALTSSSPISGGAAETSSSTASTSTSMASLSSSIPTPSNTTSPSAINSPNPIAAAAKSKEKSLGAIVGGVVGAAVGALVILVALCIWGKHRRRGQLFKRERPATFYGDKMVKSSSEQTPQALESSFERVGAASGLGRTSHHSRSLASSRNSSIDQANEKTPALGAHTRSINSSIFSDDDEDGDSSLRSRSSNIDQSAGLGLGRLSPRTDRQMDLEQRIHDLKAQLISLSDDSAQGGESTDSHASRTLFDIRAKIRRLEGLEHSQWAMELTDEVPRDFLP